MKPSPAMLLKAGSCWPSQEAARQLLLGRQQAPAAASQQQAARQPLHFQVY
jgi:hypothetical protein